MLFLYTLRWLFVFIYLFTILVYHIVLWILNDSFIHLIMRCNTFYILLDLTSYYFVEEFYIYIHQRYWPAIFFLCIVFFFFGLFVFVSGFPHKMNMFHLFHFLLNLLHLFGRVSMWICQRQFLITNSVLLLVACPAYLDGPVQPYPAYLFLSDSVLTLYMFLKI